MGGRMGTLELIVTVLTYFLVITVLNCKLAEGWKPRHFPKIGISEYAMEDDEDRHRWETDVEKMPEGAVTITENGQTYIVSEPILAMTIDCNASYPVQWTFLNAEDASENVYSVRIRMLRIAKDVYNPLTNSFTSQLQLYGDTNAITGEYACFSTEYEDVRKKIYIYWKGDSPSPLIPQERTEDACIKEDNTVVLPCRVSDPDARPKLYFEIKCNDKYKLVNTPFLKYHPKVGFTLDLNQYNGAFGRYKCAMSDDDSFPGYFNLKNETCLPHKFNDTITGGASLHFDKKEQKLVCCSSSSIPPSLQAIFCLDPVSCRMRESRLFKNGNNGVSLRANGSCVYEKIFQRDSGMMRCKGDGIDVTRPFYTELQQKRNDSFDLYFDWNAIPQENLVSLTVGTRKPFYDRQNISVTCDTSYFYFAEGVKWAVRWKNGSLEFLDSEIYGQDRAMSTLQTIRLPLDLNMTELLCFAPIWNSTEWVNKTYKLEIKRSSAPRFEKEEVEIINFNLNDTEQVLACHAKGTPSPLLRWRKNNRTVLNENNMGLKRRNGTLFLTIHRISHETQGEYRCIANNLAGRVEKVTQVYVIDPGQPLSASAIAFVIVLVIILCGGMGFLLWRMQLQRKLITHLTGIVFRDMGTSAEHTPNGSATSAVRSQNLSSRAQVTASNGGLEFSVSPFPAQVIQEPNNI